jgi:hypothetical protein
LGTSRPRPGASKRDKKHWEKQEVKTNKDTAQNKIKPADPF